MLLTGMMGNAVPGWLITYFHVLSCFNNKSMHFKSPLSIEIWAQNTGWESSSTNIIVVWNYWAAHHMLSRNSKFFHQLHNGRNDFYLRQSQLCVQIICQTIDRLNSKILPKIELWNWLCILMPYNSLTNFEYEEALSPERTNFDKKISLS